jgi:Tfp pilus assembly protein FimT
MMSRNKSFTLLESLIVLSIVSLLMLLGVNMQQHHISTTRFIQTYDAFYQQARQQAIAQQRDVTVNYDDAKISTQGLSHETQLNLPNDWYEQPQTLTIKAGGYVSPKTIKIQTPKGTVSLIYSLAGGEYRVETP